MHVFAISFYKPFTNQNTNYYYTVLTHQKTPPPNMYYFKQKLNKKQSSSTKTSTLNSTNETTTTQTEDITQINVCNLNQTPNESRTNEDHNAGSVEKGLPSPIISNNNNNNNTSLLIIDQDELNSNNESQVIQKIIDEYERRLQEQLALAREDIAHEFVQQIQVSDCLHFPLYHTTPHLRLCSFICFSGVYLCIIHFNLFHFLFH